MMRGMCGISVHGTPPYVRLDIGHIVIGLHPMVAYSALSGLCENDLSKFKYLLLDVLEALKGRYILTMGTALRKKLAVMSCSIIIGLHLTLG
jgi:hypothetical protein